MKQTVVDFLVETFDLEMQDTFYLDKINQAREMFEEQIKDAWFDGVTNWDSEKNVEDYINETFKKI